MDGTQHIVQTIVLRCRNEGLDVTETLAAFMARAMMMEDSKRFQLDKELTEDDLTTLIDMSVDRLAEKDSPSLETIKMQVAFDTSYVEQQEQIEDDQRVRDKRNNALVKDVLEVRAKGDSDFEALTALYRKIFTFLMVKSGVEDMGDRAVEREVAAALESVFPRVGLNSFLALSAPEKTSQLNELAKIVLGIRLFNREIGKGGIGLVDLPNIVSKLSGALDQELQAEIDEQSDLTQQYVEVIHHMNTRMPPTEDTSRQVKRLQEELTNRRQYLSYVQSLQEDLGVTSDRLEKANSAFQAEMTKLKQMVGTRTSVPKEQVYPRFIMLANHWDVVTELQAIVHARAQTLQGLREYRVSFRPMLRPSIVEEAREATEKEAMDDDAGRGDLQPVGLAEEDTRDGPELMLAEGDRPVIVPCDSSPEFLQLPLEYQGFCPWTILHRGSLLLPGNPALGVVRYAGKYYTLVNEWAMESFIKNPQKYVDAVLAAANRSPELIHLLRLQEAFPEAAITRLIKGARSGMDSTHHLLAPAAPTKADAETQTPVHFTAPNIDFTYEWNEWALRRRALHLANLQNKRTHSVQTIMSHFRRENESQTYLPKEKSTQIIVDKSTNVARRVNYIEGLRGDPESRKVTVQFVYDPDTRKDPRSRRQIS